MPAAAQVVRPGPWEGSLEGVLDVDRQDTRTTGRPRSRFQALGAQEVLTLRNSGLSVYDPRLLTLSLGATFGLFQEEITAGEPASGARGGTLWGYDLLATVLDGAPLSLDVFASRTESVLGPELPGRTKTLAETLGATLAAQWLPLPSTLTVRRERLDEESRTGDTTAQRSEERRVIRYEGQRGWTDGELDLRYEWVDLADRVYPTLSYQSHEGILNGSLDLGPEGDWHWDSRLRAYARAGGTLGGAPLTDLTTWTVDETLTVDHTAALQTRYRYLLLHTEVDSGATTIHTAAFTLRHQLYESLRTTFAADGTVQALPGGERDVARGRLDLAYDKRLPGGGRLRAGLGGGLQYEDDRFRAAETLVAQETHTAATPFALPLPLRTLFVVEATVVVTKVATGPLPLGCVPAPGPPTPLALGQDYTLRTVSDVTELVPLPCAGAAAGINPGDTVAVDYRVRVPAALAFTTAAWRADLAVDYGWARVYLAHERSDQTRVAGRDGEFLDDLRSSTAGAELRHDGERVQTSLLGEARRFVSTHVSYDTLRGSQALGVVLIPDLRLQVDAEEWLTRFREQDRQSRSVAGRVTLTWTLDADLLAEAMGGAGWLEDTLFPSERTVGGRLRVRWRFRKLEVNPTLEYASRRRGDTETTEYRLTVQVIRRF